MSYVRNAPVIANNVLAINSGVVARLSTILPSTTQFVTTYAILILEAFGATDPDYACRYKMDASDPTTAIGMPMGHLEARELTLVTDINNFFIIPTEAAKAYSLSVEFHGYLVK